LLNEKGISPVNHLFTGYWQTVPGYTVRGKCHELYFSETQWFLVRIQYLKDIILVFIEHLTIIRRVQIGNCIT
jgi:hypothetical protein